MLAILAYTNASMFSGQPQFTIQADKDKAFSQSCLIKTFTIKNGNIADCLEHCLKNCRCQSFQVCQNEKCQLCSSHKEENNSLLHDQNGCDYATHEIRHLTFQVYVQGRCKKHNWDRGFIFKYSCSSKRKNHGKRNQ